MALLGFGLLREFELVAGRGPTHCDHVAIEAIKGRGPPREELEVLALAGLVLRLDVRDAPAALVARVVLPIEPNARERSEGRRDGVAVLRLGTRPLLLLLLLLLGLLDRRRRRDLLVTPTARRARARLRLALALRSAGGGLGLRARALARRVHDFDVGIVIAGHYAAIPLRKS